MKQKIITFFAHLEGWILFLSLLIAFVTRASSGAGLWNVVVSWPFLLFCAVYLFVFYINGQVLLPFLYLKKLHAMYIAAVAVLFVFVFLLRPFDRFMSDFSRWGRPFPRANEFRVQPDGPLPSPAFRDTIRDIQNRLSSPAFRDSIRDMNDPPPSSAFLDSGRDVNAARQGEARYKRNGPPANGTRTDIVSIILFIAVWSLSTAIFIIREWRRTERRAIQAEADKANAELVFLKAQINPHFLFNTLNNIYSLAVTKNENTPESILKLSNIMRYVTDEVRANFVPLDNELQCIGDYIDLQRLRLGKKMQVSFQITGETSGRMIAPLLLMTFIENVFKYGISNHEPSDIRISLDIAKSSIVFECQNKLYDTPRNIERTGIGLVNTTKRLEHLYPDRHVLSIEKANGLFTVYLELKDPLN